MSSKPDEVAYYACGPVVKPYTHLAHGSPQTGTPGLAWFMDTASTRVQPFQHRPGAGLLLGVIRAGHITQVLVDRWDRLGQDQQAIREAVAAIEDAGATVLVGQ